MYQKEKNTLPYFENNQSKIHALFFQLKYAKTLKSESLGTAGCSQCGAESKVPYSEM